MSIMQAWDEIAGQAERDRKDAARYRWWRDNFGVEYDGPDSLKLYTIINSRFRRGLSEHLGFDAAIDGAMAGTNHPGDGEQVK